MATYTTRTGYAPGFVAAFYLQSKRSAGAAMLPDHCGLECRWIELSFAPESWLARWRLAQARAGLNDWRKAHE